MQDGEAIQVNVESAPGIELGEHYSSCDDNLRYQVYHWLGVKAAISAGYRFGLQAVHCGGCRLFLGCKICDLPADNHQAGEDDSDSDEDPRQSKLAGTVHITRDYLYTARQDGGPAEGHDGLQTFACAGVRGPGECGNVLFRLCDVLSMQHIWNCGGGPEEAWFVNSAAPGSVEARSQTMEQLAQGTFEVQRTFCSSCGAEVGWKFSRNLELTSRARTHDCRRYEGRYGFVKSRFKVSSTSS
mmetsp:Transcript_24114/g.67060  ORF Transcript_24114/g.67060 Transcript_24114/m.67060 type:complete len:242 (-) Transcript_24114:233-958(-)